jgi:Fe-S-cluster-containing dehydrogenase component
MGRGLSRIFIDYATVDMMHKVNSCQQCKNHPCLDACPEKVQAMQIDENGIVYIDEEKCVGCRACYRACPFEPKRIGFNPKTKKSLKCDLCRGREGGPACIEDCQVSCIGLSNKPIPKPEVKAGLSPTDQVE